MTVNIELKAKLLEVVNDNWPATAESVEHLNTDFYDLGLDSLDVSSLMLAVEECFSITVEDEALENIKTIENIYEFLITELK